jgi:hypothetical protein
MKEVKHVDEKVFHHNFQQAMLSYVNQNICTFSKISLMIVIHQSISDPV